jgi:antitoxin (DNA-binding transcriptional repressor) of toxin-antitoxin stability system
MKATIVDLRYRMKDVLRAIDRGEKVTVLYRGKERAEIFPVQPKEESASLRDQPFFGMWAQREDMEDPVAFVRAIRKNRLAR